MSLWTVEQRKAYGGLCPNVAKHLPKAVEAKLQPEDQTMPRTFAFDPQHTRWLDANLSAAMACEAMAVLPIHKYSLSGARGIHMAASTLLLLL